jgi:Phage-related protein
LLKDYFIFDGTNSQDVGVFLQQPLTFGAALQNADSQKIPGRNGDLVIYDGSYSNVVGEARCFALASNVDKVLYTVNQWTMLGRGYKRLETSAEPDVFRLARVSGGAKTDIRCGVLAPFTIEFSCKPQRFLRSGELETTMRSSGVLYNEWFPALPLITVYGSGSGKLSICGTVVTFSSIDEFVTLDCDTQNAYKGTTNKNSTITAPEFPVLEHGECSVSWSGGITKIDIVPRWWTL